ncbi:malic enzyme [Loa loa]|uniref:Malic enzyme n=1 Tax=Loa loa TaxID=7209 RepID=A0A1S0UH14_LOALO|nr:malic enzyme [Loa loa]EJD74104.1 malic enzyme [Loa loa]
MALTSARLPVLHNNTLANMKLLAYSTIRAICTTAINYSDLTHSHEMSEQEIALYKLYRPERVTPKKRGIDLLNDSRINKGMAFSLFERQYLGIHGLLPPAFMTDEQQTYRIITQLRQQPNDLARYIQLDGLQDRNEKLFYRLLCEHVNELMPIVYTPTVGLACQNFGYIYRKPKGLYITINDNSISKIHHILSNWPESDVRAIVVTDGERILGLGDLGCYGIGIPVGKLALYVALGGVQPKWCLPVLLDVGTNNEELLNDPFYIGLRRKRVRGAEYDRLIENFFLACRKRFGQKVLVQFEDFANQNAYRLLDIYRNKYCTFNDDIQGTASVAVAGLLACWKYTGKSLAEGKFVFLGAGTASMGIAELCVAEMITEGLTKQQAYDRIFLMDIDGLITKNRKNLSDLHKPYAKDLPETKSLLEVVKKVKPWGLIGASTVRGAFTEEIVREMASINEHPIIFALSNPTNKAECTAEEAYRWTDGKVLFASGSPFPNVEYNGKIFKPGQGNNAYIFPGVGLGAILFNVRHIDDETFLIAAHEVANTVTDKDFKLGRLYPRLNRIRELSVKIALAVGEHAYKKGMAGLYPKPNDMEHFVRSQIYQTTYDELINVTYEWPAHDMKHGFPVPVSRRESVDE